MFIMLYFDLLALTYESYDRYGTLDKQVIAIDAIADLFCGLNIAAYPL